MKILSLSTLNIEPAFIIFFSFLNYFNTLPANINLSYLGISFSIGKKWILVNGKGFDKVSIGKSYYRLFSIDSGSQFAFDPKKALGAGGKTGKVREKDPETKKVKIVFSRPRDIVMDEDFEDGDNKQRVMEKGQQAKYEQDDLSKRVLLATKDAKLVHYIKQRGGPKPPVIFYNTMSM